MKHLRPAWTSRTRASDIAGEAGHAAVAAAVHARVGHRSFRSHASTAQRRAITRARSEAIRKRFSQLRRG